MKNKISVGILCYRYNTIKEEMEYLLIAKNYSLTFFRFILGKYEMNDINITDLRNNELIMLKHNNPYKLYKDIFNTYKTYHTYSNPKTINTKFKKYLSVNNINLNELNIDINDVVYEIPKGKINNNEEQKKCGIRELKEETGMDIKDKKKLKFVYKNIKCYNNNKYQDIYYSCSFPIMCTFIDDIPLCINDNNEILYCNWYTLYDIKNKSIKVNDITYKLINKVL